MIEIKDWVVFEGSGSAAGEFFVKPYNIRNYTNAVVTFDSDTKVGVDVDGLTFKLVGEADPSRTGRGVCGHWFGNDDNKRRVDMVESSLEAMVAHLR